MKKCIFTIITLSIFFCFAIFYIYKCDKTIESLTEDIAMYEDIIEYKHPKIIEYYEELCQEFGYLTYEQVYDAEYYGYYVDETTKLIHRDWLCKDFITKDDFFRTDYTVCDYAKYTVCECCEQFGTFLPDFLDDESDIYHKGYNIFEGTKDYKTRIKEYRFVTEESAINAGYSLCPLCEEYLPHEEFYTE